MADELTNGALVEQYFKIKDHLETETKKFTAWAKPYRDGMEAFENELLRRLNEQDCQNFATDAGTAYKSTTMRPKVVDRDKFLQFCTDHWDELGSEMLLVSAQVDSVKRYLDDNQDPGAIGIETTFNTRVNLRRS